MGEEKRNKVIAAATINAILLVVILIAVIIAQVVEISIKRNYKNTLLQEYNQLVAEYDLGKATLDRLEADENYRLLVIECVKAGITEEELAAIRDKYQNKDN